jgi:hypothetical protein
MITTLTSTNDIFVQQVLTRSALLYLSRRNCKNEQSLDHYSRDRIYHFLIRCYFGVD